MIDFFLKILYYLFKSKLLQTKYCQQLIEQESFLFRFARWSSTRINKRKSISILTLCFLFPINPFRTIVSGLFDFMRKRCESERAREREKMFFFDCFFFDLLTTTLFLCSILICNHLIIFTINLKSMFYLLIYIVRNVSIDFRLLECCFESFLVIFW
jgi:hypothetical protein